MATFTSPEVILNRSAEDFFNKIGDLNNLKDIMPSSIKDFESTETTCSFKMKGMPQLKLELGNKIEFSKISLTASGSQVPFSLDCFITEKGKQCQARLEINAELNMMMKKMVEKPLTQFLDVLASKMQNF
jgi:carbon monoxide dehydrogenase subunit G